MNQPETDAEIRQRRMKCVDATLVGWVCVCDNEGDAGVEGNWEQTLFHLYSTEASGMQTAMMLCLLPQRCEFYSINLQQDNSHEH